MRRIRAVSSCSLLGFTRALLPRRYPVASSRSACSPTCRSEFSAASGPGSVEAARMAIEDFKGSVAGARIESWSADHLNKPDVGSLIARRWIDEDGVDVIVDLGNSAVALAVASIAQERDKAILVSSGGCHPDRGSLHSHHGALDL